MKRTIYKINPNEGSYYKINGTKKILYWDGEKWMLPVKDQQKRYGSWLSMLDVQPIVKTIELIDITTHF